VDRTDVVVIGAGVMGSAAAVALAARGADTVLLERFTVGHSRGSSHGPTRIFRISYPQPDYARLSLRALDAWRVLEEAAGERLLVTTGGLDVGPVAEDCARSLTECGVAHDWLSPGDVAQRFPSIALDPGGGRVLFQPAAGVCLADRTVTAQVRVAGLRGVDVREETEVLRLGTDEDGVEVGTDRGVVRAKVAVVTAGVWAGRVLHDVNRSLPLTPILQHVSYFAPAPGADPAEMPTLVEWEGEAGQMVSYAVPDVGEAPGVKVGEHAGGTEVDPRDGPFEVDPARVRSHAAYAARRLPLLDPTPVRSETCLYTMTPDEDFVLDRVGNVVIGAGFSGHGFKFGPLIGEILADLAQGTEPGIPLERFSVRRL
jgi:sarcosine oxidase